MSARLPLRWLVLCALASLCVMGGARAAVPARVSDVRLWTGPEGTRLVLDLSAPVRHEVFSIDAPDRVVIDLRNARLAMSKALPTGQGPVKGVRAGPQDGGGLRIVLDLVSPQPVKSFMVGPEGKAGHRLVVEIPPTAQGTPRQSSPDQQAVPAAAPSASRSSHPPQPRSRVKQPPVTNPVKTLAVAKGRDLVIAVDAGHGARTRARSAAAARAKGRHLAIARRLAKAIDAEEGMRAVLIRDGDYFITLAGRTRKARQLGADMFVSVHADSVLNREVSGASCTCCRCAARRTKPRAGWRARECGRPDGRRVARRQERRTRLGAARRDAEGSGEQQRRGGGRVLASLRRVGKVHGSRVGTRASSCSSRPTSPRCWSRRPSSRT